MKKARDVEEYIATAPLEVQDKLGQLRAIILGVAPEAEEKISYGMPYYGYKGRLAYFAYAKHHIGLYLMPPVIENHAQELRDYVTSKATVQLPLDEKLPVALIKTLLRAGVAKNEGL